MWLIPLFFQIAAFLDPEINSYLSMADYEEVERDFAKEYPSRLYQQANSTRSNAFINKSRPMNA